jgi:histidinol-phosphate aminotransferase
MKPIEELVHAHIRAMEPYTPGRQPTGEGWIKLNTNELPYPPPAEVVKAIAAEVPRLARYPDPRSDKLREAVASKHGLSSSQVIIGNGSDDILNLLARAFGGQDRSTVDTFPSYSLYPVITAIAGGEIESVPFPESMELPVDALAASGADLLFLTCPNAPTGVRFPLEALERLAGMVDGLLVIDEAYADFAEVSAVALLASCPNVVVTRTFSKAYGLAGLRVGYGMASASVVDILDRIRDSYNVNRLSQAGALAALEAQPAYDAFISEIKVTRDRTAETLRQLGWSLYPSEANFLFGAPGGAGNPEGEALAAGLFKRLEEQRILVRYFPKHPLTAPYLRISIGSPSEMDRFIEEVTSWHKRA